MTIDVWQYRLRKTPHNLEYAMMRPSKVWYETTYEGADPSSPTSELTEEEDSKIEDFLNKVEL